MARMLLLKVSLLGGGCFGEDFNGNKILQKERKRKDRSRLVLCVRGGLSYYMKFLLAFCFFSLLCLFFYYILYFYIAHINCQYVGLLGKVGWNLKSYEMWYQFLYFLFDSFGHMSGAF